MNKLNENFLWCLKVQIPSEVEESIIWKLTSLGITSFSFENNFKNIDFIQLSIWLSSSDWGDKDINNLFLDISNLLLPFDQIIPAPSYSKVTNDNWEKKWQKYWKPDPVGTNLLILPSWLDIPKEFSSRKVVKIDPGAAFGTGSHPSTRLCLEAIDKDLLKGLSIADIGCGSGILGISAFLNGAEFVSAVDIDSFAIESTISNIYLNKISKKNFIIKKGSIENIYRGKELILYDRIFCNILAPTIKELIPSLKNFIAPFGKVFLSGLLESQVDDLRGTLDDYGWDSFRCATKNKWSLIKAMRY